MAEQQYHIGKLDCAHCAQEVETGVARLDGVSAVRVDFNSGRMTLSGDVPYEQLKARVEALGKTIHRPDEAADLSPVTRGGLIGFWDYLMGRPETRLALLGGLITILTLVADLLLTLPAIASSTGYTVGMGVALLPIARSGIRSLWINREFNINLLMTIAAVGAVIIGEYLEASTVIFLFAIGEALEGYTADRARQGLRSLIALKPLRALRINADGSEIEVPVEALAIGDRVLVRAGERLPVDGQVIAGASGVDQAPITGESVPVHKSAGDAVYAGSINGQGTLTVATTQLAADNTLSRIVRLVEEAQSSRATSQRLIDRFAHYYTPGIVVLALLVATIPPLLGQPFFDVGATHGWFYRALALLVIACPCALVISTPVTIISAIASAARQGVLIKGGLHLESLGRIRAVAFDKTGTLTQGRPSLTGYHALDCTGQPDCAPCGDLLALAAAVESRSTHPLAQAVTEAARTRQLSVTYAAAESVETLAGRGVQGWVAQQQITIGSHSLFDEAYPHSPALCETITTAEAQGQTTMLLALGDEVRGYLTVADPVRPESKAVLSELRQMGLQTVMLTGDNPRVAAAVGAALGVADVRAGLLPEDKVSAVHELLREYEGVAMVGDGINDTPALAAATVGIAMGGAGSAQALEAADVALMSDDVHRLPFALRLARKARAIIFQNIALSVALKLVFVALAITGDISLWLAVFADVGMLMIVTLNGMRPLRLRATGT